MNTIEWPEFAKVYIAVVLIIDVSDLPKAGRPAYVLEIDLEGNIGTNKSSAQITKLNDHSPLLGKHTMAVSNLPPKQVSTIISKVLVLAFVRESGEVVLAIPELPISNVSVLS